MSSKEKVKLISGAVFTLLLVVVSWIVVFNRAFNEGREYGRTEMTQMIDEDMDMFEWDIRNYPIAINHTTMVDDHWESAFSTKYDENTGKIRFEYLGH